MRSFLSEKFCFIVSHRPNAACPSDRVLAICFGKTRVEILTKAGSGSPDDLFFPPVVPEDFVTQQVLFAHRAGVCIFRFGKTRVEILTKAGSGSPDDLFFPPVVPEDFVTQQVLFAHRAGVCIFHRLLHGPGTFLQ